MLKTIVIIAVVLIAAILIYAESLFQHDEDSPKMSSFCCSAEKDHS